MRNKVLYFISYVIMVLSLIQCAPAITKQYINKKNNQVMEKIDINALLKARKIETSNIKIVVENKRYLPDGRVSNLDYYEEDHRTGKTTIISWIPTLIIKKVYTIDSPIVHIYNFYPDGSLRSQYEKYIGYVTKGRDIGQFNFSFGYDVVIGKLYLYDQNGNIEKVTDYDENYPYSIEQVLRLIKEKYTENIEELQIRQKQNYHTKVYYWEVIYSDSENHSQQLYIDGRTGEVTEKGLYIIHES